MAFLPVWCAGWALGCCGNDHAATVGRHWSPSLFTSIDKFELTDAALGWTAVDDDEVAIVGEMNLDEARSPQPFIDLGTTSSQQATSSKADSRQGPRSTSTGTLTSTTRAWRRRSR